MTGEKTEKATPKRRKEARKEGQVARTPELGGWASLLLATLALPALVRHEVNAIQSLFRDALGTISDPSVAEALRVLREGATHAFISVVALGGCVLLVGVAASLAQGGFYLATKLVKPSAKKLNPVSGLKRLFGPHALWEGAKTLLKSAAVGLVFWMTLRSMLPVLGSHATPDALLAFTGHKALVLVRNIAVAGLVMASIDYAMARRRTGKQTKMSKEDIKQEHRQSEGDPMLKGAIRSRQLAAARNRMMADIPDADVVLVNPTHVAVALSYDPASGAPKVVARGAGVVAARIREVATEARVPLVRDIPLARALYSSTEVGQEIPAELFAAVAQVLAFVISRRNRGQSGGEHRTPREETELVAPPKYARRRRPRPEADAPQALPEGRENPSSPALTGR